MTPRVQPTAPEWPAAAALATAPAGERLRLLGTSASGLSAADAAARLKQSGPNEPVRPAASHPLRALASQFTHTLALLLWFAAGLAFAANIPELGAAIVAVIAVNGVFAFVQEYRAGQVVESLMERVAVRARVVRESAVAVLPAAELVPGDVVHLSAGDIVPADCVVIESDSLTLDLSMLTGESVPVERSGDFAETTLPEDAPSLLPAGCGVVTGTATAAVWATGAASSIGRVASLVEDVKRHSSVLEQQVAALSRVTAVVAVFSGAATLGLAASFTETSFIPALTFATGVIVALVPEGLLPTLSVSLAIGARRMAERGAAVRRLSAVEVVGSVTVICTDKTGTLTENALTVEKVAGPDGVSNAGTEAILAAVLCNDAAEERDGLAGDPLDVALWCWAAARHLDVSGRRKEHPRLKTVPFDARTRYMAVTCAGKSGALQYVKGAPEAVLALAGEDAIPATLHRTMAEAAERGARLLLLASGPSSGRWQSPGSRSSPTRRGPGCVRRWPRATRRGFGLSCSRATTPARPARWLARSIFPKTNRRLSMVGKSTGCPMQRSAGSFRGTR